LKKPSRRLGRPPASASEDTRERILTAAQKCFALRGYDKTTNKDIADEAGITAGALYYYFVSKRELFAALLAEHGALVVSELAAAAAQHDTVVNKVCAIFDRAAVMHRDDPYIARFMAVAPIEVSRHADEFITPAESHPHGTRDLRDLFQTIVRDGQVRGEIPAIADSVAVANMFVAVALGINQFAGLYSDREAHRAVVEAFKGLVRDQLLVRENA
jgi:AcrR family transcriptional regulator